MPNQKVIDVNVQLRQSDLSSLVIILGGVVRLHVGVQNKDVIMHDLKHAIDPEAATKLWDLFVKVQADSKDKEEVDEVIEVKIPGLKIFN